MLFVTGTAAGRHHGHGRPPSSPRPVAALLLLPPLPRGLAGLAQHLNGQVGQLGLDGVLDGGAAPVVVEGGAGGADAAQVVDDADEGRWVFFFFFFVVVVVVPQGRGQEPSAAAGDVLGMGAQVQRGAAVGVPARGGGGAAAEEELDDGRIVPRGRGVVEGGPSQGVDVVDGGAAEAVEGPDDVEGGVAAAGGVQDARRRHGLAGWWWLGQGAVDASAGAAATGSAAAGGLGCGCACLGEKSPQIVPCAALDEVLGGGEEAERLRLRRTTGDSGIGQHHQVGARPTSTSSIDGGGAAAVAGDGQASEGGAGCRFHRIQARTGAGTGIGAAATYAFPDALDVGDANPPSGRHDGADG